MVGAINPNTSTAIGHQQQRARDSAYMLNPGESFPPEAPISSATPEPTSTAEPSTPASKSSTRGNKHDLSAGVIGGIVVATVVVILVGILIFVLVRRLKTKFQREPEYATSSSWPYSTSMSPVPQYSGPPTELPSEKF
jgi:hypothetical protein